MAVAQRRVGRYEIIRQIGRGGMATVYLARQETLDREVALKELSSFHASSSEVAQRFLRESRLAGSLNHPNIVTVLEYFEHDTIPYIAMEYVRRGSLRPYVGKLSLAQFVGVMEGVLAALAHAGAQGIVHRDLKPENIMVTSDGRVKITDFGIAKATQSAGTGLFLTAAGTTVGTPSYMAPEQAMARDIGIWTDLYSLGVMAWEHAVGHVPFYDSEAPMVILTRQLNEVIPPAASMNPDVDPEVSEWIDRLLIKDPEQRARDPSIVWDELEEIIISKLGPRWRREARLPSPSQVFETPHPLTPAPFESQHVRTPEPAAPAEPQTPAGDSAYVTFGPSGERVTPPGAAEGVAPAGDVLTPPDAGEVAAEAAAAAPSIPVDTPDAPAAPAEPAPAVTPAEQTPPPPATAGSTYVTFGAAGAPVAPSDSEPASPAGQEAVAPAEPESVIPAEPPQGASVKPETPAAGEEAAVDGETLPGLEQWRAGRAAAPAEALEEPADAGARAEILVESPSTEETHLEPAPTAETPVEAAPTAESPVEPPPTEESRVEPAPTDEPAPTVTRERDREGRPARRGTVAARRRAVVAGVVGIAAAAAIGFLLAPKSGNPPPPQAALVGSASTGPINLSLPTGWHTRPATVTPALKLNDQIAVGPGQAAGGELVIGTARTSDPTLLPDGFLHALPAAPSQQVVTLGHAQFYRYLGLQPRGATAPMSVYALPTTSAGTVLAACLLQGAGPAFPSDCERVLSTLQLGGTSAAGLGPSSSLGSALNRVVGKLNARVGGAQARLSSARRPAQQASAAATLSAAYGQAAASVRTLSAPPSATAAVAALAAALGKTGRDYTTLSHAASQNNGRAYNAARAVIGSDRGAVSAAFGQLAKLGYTTS